MCFHGCGVSIAGFIRRITHTHTFTEECVFEAFEIHASEVNPCEASSTPQGLYIKYAHRLQQSKFYEYT